MLKTCVILLASLVCLSNGYGPQEYFSEFNLLRCMVPNPRAGEIDQPDTKEEAIPVLPFHVVYDDLGAWFQPLLTRYVDIDRENMLVVMIMGYCQLATVEPPNKGHFGLNSFVLCREVVPFSEGPLSEVPLYVIALYAREKGNDKRSVIYNKASPNFLHQSHGTQVEPTLGMDGCFVNVQRWSLLRRYMEMYRQYLGRGEQFVRCISSFRYKFFIFRPRSPVAGEFSARLRDHLLNYVGTLANIQLSSAGMLPPNVNPVAPEAPAGEIIPQRLRLVGGRPLPDYYIYS